MTNEDRRTHAMMLFTELHKLTPDILVIVWLMNQLGAHQEMEIIVRRRNENARLTA